MVWTVGMAKLDPSSQGALQLPYNPEMGEYRSRERLIAGCNSSPAPSFAQPGLAPRGGHEAWKSRSEH